MGTVTVDGAGSTWTNSAPLVVGNEGDGTVTVQHGGVASTTNDSRVGNLSGSVGTATVTGAGSQWNSGNHLYVGQNGTGTLNVEAGGTVTNNSGIVGFTAGASGTATVTGTGSQWNNSNLYVGGSSTAAGGTGNLSIQDNGLVTVAGTSKVWGAGTVDLTTGGSLDVGGTLQIANGGTVTVDSASSLSANNLLTEGQLNWSGNLNVSAGESPNAIGALSATNGGSVSGDTLHIYSDGAVTVDAASSLSATQIIADGDLNWAGGILNVDTGQTLSGSGDLSGVGMLAIANGGMIAPGNSTGTLTAGDVTWGPGGFYDFEVNDFNGVAGSNLLGWDLLMADSIDITATGLDPFGINLVSLTSGQVGGLSDNFDGMTDYSLLFASTTGGITGFGTGLFSFDTTGFQNSFGGDWSVSQAGNDLFVNYSVAAVPEPSSIIVLGLGAVGFVTARRRKRTRTGEKTKNKDSNCSAAM